MIENRKTQLQKTKQRLLALAPIKEDKFKVLIETARILTEHMAPYNSVHSRPIVVGGLSVEFYTHNDYTTRDLDIVTSSSMRLREDLRDMGFDTSERVFILKELELVIDVVDGALEGDYTRITEVPVANEHGEEILVSIISIEDIILDRLDAFENEDPRYWGLEMLTRYYDEIDFNYMKEKVKEKHKKAQEIYETWIATIEEERKKEND